MDELKAFLMPFPFIRYWSYDELLPALLCFDQVTFLMPDIDTPDHLVDPKDLKGMDDKETVNGLLVEQHRYFFPMRDLMQEKVIAISSLELGHMSGPGNDIRDLVQHSESSALANEFVTSAASYYDALGLNESGPSNEVLALMQQSSTPYVLDEFRKAARVRAWIQDGLQFRRRKNGWQHVALHPDGYRALASALGLFKDLRRLTLPETPSGEKTPWWSVPRSDKEEGEAAYATMRVTFDLLGKELSSFQLKDEADPNALSEILEVREKRADDLRNFRQAILTASQDFKSQNLNEFVTAIDDYAHKLEPSFAELENAMSGMGQINRLVLRPAGGILISGVSAFIGAAMGTTIVGPIGTAAGLTIGYAAGEGVKAIVKELGKLIADKSKGDDIPVDTSLVYLFHASKALTHNK